MPAMRESGWISRRGKLWALAALAARGAFALSANAQETRPAPQGVVHTLPESQRTYEVLLPPGQPKDLANLPLVLYLHPSGEPQLDRAKRDYWPILSARGCLMVLPAGRTENRMWLAGEEKFLADVLADVQTRHSVDARRIILLGVSGGGQVALFLADRLPKKFRAVIVVATSPVVIRGREHEWFYPAREALRTCPYLVVNHITQGSSLMYWRQVQAKLNPAGASISILPVTGEVGEYLPPPKELSPWLAEVLAGKHPAALPDPQRGAVAKMFDSCAAGLPAAIASAKSAPAGERIAKEGKPFRLEVQPPADFQRSAGEQPEAQLAAGGDPAAAPPVQIRLEHKDWPIYIRCEARATGKSMDQVIAEEQARTVERGMLYQVYREGALSAGGRTWKYKIGSITYPDRRRGWVSTLFIHAAAPVAADPRQWLTALVSDETQQPEAKELAAILKTVLSTVAAGPAPNPPAPTRPARTP